MAAAVKTCSLMLFLSFAVLTEAFSNCRCGLFTTSSFGEGLLYELPGIDVDSCKFHLKCKILCQKEFRTMTNGGDLYHIMNDGYTSVGQFLCQSYADDLHNEYVYGYYELCNGPWEYIERHSKQMLCCSDGVQNPCTGRSLRKQ